MRSTSRNTHTPDHTDANSTPVVRHIRIRLMRARVRVTLAGLALIFVSACVTAALVHEPRVRVLTTNRDMRSGEILNRDDLSFASLPAAAVPRHPLRHLNTTVGHRLVGPIARGDALSSERISLPAPTEEGMRVALTVDAATGHALAPGDTVDVWQARAPDGFVSQQSAERVASHVQVISVVPQSGTLQDAALLVVVAPRDVPRVVAAKADGSALIVMRRA